MNQYGDPKAQKAATSHSASLLTGPELDSLVAEASVWYLEQRKFLVEGLLAGAYPYGTTPLTEAEQVANYDAQTPEDRARMTQTLMNIWKGDKDQATKVQTSLDAYDAQMQHLKAVMRNPLPIGTPPGEVG